MNNLPIILAFGGAYIMGLIFLHLVPEAFGFNSIAGIFVLVGFLVQIFLEYISKGLEHGHAPLLEHNQARSTLVTASATYVKLDNASRAI